LAVASRNKFYGEIANLLRTCYGNWYNGFGALQSYKTGHIADHYEVAISGIKQLANIVNI